MGRRVKKTSEHKPGERRTVVPDVTIDGWSNAKDPQPVTVTVRQPHEGEKMKILSVDDRLVGSTVGLAVHTVDLALLTAVEKVENYEDSEGEAIEDAQGLVLRGEFEIKQAVADEIIRNLGLGTESKKG